MSSPSSDTDYDIAAGWRAVIALVVGFFMILLDTTIVTVAMPRIMSGLGASTSDVVWVTSAYLLAFAVPLLITGRLGDRFGPRRIYLIGITVFTLASALCGFAGSITALIAGRVAQGVGASMISPQSMSVITRMFPPTRRGAVMGMWGAVGGVAALSGPMLGGFILQMASWEWIFRINLPIGALAFVGAWKLVPRLPTHGHRFDLLGVALSAVGMFCLVFGLEEGSRYHWGQIAGPISIPLLLTVGTVVMALFVWWQSRAPEPLVPLSLFRDRDFTAANIGVMCMGGIATAMNIPLFLHLQTGRGVDPFVRAARCRPRAVHRTPRGPDASSPRRHHRFHPVVRESRRHRVDDARPCPHVVVPDHLRRRRCRQQSHLGTTVGVGDAQPPPRTRRCRIGRLQHDAADGCRARDGRDRNAHDQPAHGPSRTRVPPSHGRHHVVAGSGRSHRCGCRCRPASA